MPSTSKAVAPKEDSATDVMISEETRRQFASMAMAIPDADGSGSERIVLAILAAETWDDLDAPWDKEPKDALIDKEMWIHTLMRRPSSYADGLGIFLVVRAKLVDSGREIVFSTSSISVVAQLAKAYLLDALPVLAVLRKADRPTERGYWPQHLELLGSSGAQGKRTGGK
jgi:hypothetical protein